MSRFIHTIIFLLLGTLIFAVEQPWILLERGKLAWENRNFPEALDITLQAADSMENYPEAEFWLGRIYASQGQLVLAEEQYRRALKMASFLRVPQERYNITYALAELFENNKRREDLKSILVDIADEEGFSTLEEINLEHRYIETLADKGLDELLYLYRSELRFSLAARRTLGEIAWEDERYRSALAHSSRTVLSLLSTAASRYRHYDAAWRFDIDTVQDEIQADRDVRYSSTIDGTMDLLARVSIWLPRVYRWLEYEGLWSQLYLLSVSLYAEGYENSARDLWELLVSSTQSGRWGNLASRQLEKPFVSVGSLEP